MNPHRVTSDFEEALGSYTGAPYSVAVDSCSNALFLCLKYLGVKDKEISIPSNTYMSVPCQIIHAGGKVKFKKSSKLLTGSYKLSPTPVWDSALRFTKNMYKKGQFMCLSFSGPKKILKLGKGGAILTDNELAYEWLKKARYHGRGPVSHLTDKFDMLGWNMYMPPDTAARGLLLMAGMKTNKDVSQEYQDLSKFDIYKT
jgi:dTDP-4-amino-4,6-dideoxygalactose transaminase